MSLSKSRMKADLLTKLQAAFPKPVGLQSAESTAFDVGQAALADKLSDATVTEVPNATIIVTSVTGVTAGASSSGPGTGSLT